MAESAIRECQLAYQKVLSQIKSGCTLVAVSKTKPAFLIKGLFDIGHLHFGENYVQELIAKAQLLPADIKWHFIGHLQSNKCKKLLEIPNLYVVESVDSINLAKQLNNACKSLSRKLRVYVQVNTSAEVSKFGCEPKDVTEICNFVHTCDELILSGLMTIGKPDQPKEAFQTLLNCREEVSKCLNLPANSLELSMGMSSDLEMAMEMGSTSVRVGTSIFGSRVYDEPEIKNEEH